MTKGSGNRNLSVPDRSGDLTNRLLHLYAAGFAVTAPLHHFSVQVMAMMAGTAFPAEMTSKNWIRLSELRILPPHGDKPHRLLSAAEAPLLGRPGPGQVPRVEPIGNLLAAADRYLHLGAIVAVHHVSEQSARILGQGTGMKEIQTPVGFPYR